MKFVLADGGQKLWGAERFVVARSKIESSRVRSEGQAVQGKGQRARNWSGRTPDGHLLSRGPEKKDLATSGRSIIVLIPRVGFYTISGRS